MRPMASRPYGSTYALGPGPLTPAIRALVVASGIAFVLSLIVPGLVPRLGLTPAAVLRTGAVWQPLTYMFLHGGLGYLLWNMLSLWMFGTELERRWGTRAFARFYLLCGLGAGLTQLLLAVVPGPQALPMYVTTTIGASGAIYGVLLAYGLLFPHRSILFFGIFPMPARGAVLLLGGIALVMALQEPGGGIAHTAHLGGLAAGYLLLRGGHLVADVRYWWMRRRMEQMRSRFDVHRGGRSGPSDDDWKRDWKKHVH